MPLRFVAGPRNGTQLVRTGLDNLSARESKLSSSVHDFRSLEISRPHPVYDLRADAIARGGGLETAGLSGVRYLVGDGNRTVAAAEVSVDDSGSATVLANVNYGPYVEATVQGLTEVARQNTVASEAYEVRLLRFSALYLMALWLKADSGGADIIYPLSPAPTGLNAGEAYSPEALMEIIRPLAAERIRPDRIGIP
jgi:hypothetical protein